MTLPQMPAELRINEVSKYGQCQFVNASAYDALRARIVALVPHAKHIGSCRDNIIGGYDCPCSCGLTALLAKLRDEKLIP